MQKPSALGPKGLKRTENFKGSDNGSRGFVGGQAAMLRRLKEEGLGLCTDFPNNCKETKTVSFVLPEARTHLNKPKEEVVNWKVFQLAKKDKGATAECLNPFMQGMPYGEKQPLPR